VIAARMAELKKRSRQFGFADMLDRLNAALQGENGPALRQRIISQYPVALVDEFQDTAPNQYQIFNQLYRVADNDGATGLFLIGDPKQSIYGFRGADIHSYLAARATAGAITSSAPTTVPRWRWWRPSISYSCMPKAAPVAAALPRRFPLPQSGRRLQSAAVRSGRCARATSSCAMAPAPCQPGAGLQRHAAEGRRYREFFAWHSAPSRLSAS
jgi:hypothetical protein